MILTRTEAAAAFGCSVTTIDLWVRKGAPVMSKTGKGRESQYDLPALIAWRVQSELDRALSKAERAASAEDLETLRARRLELANERAQFDLDRLRGAYVPADEIAELMHSLVAGGRAHVMGVAPHRIAAAVADGENPRAAAVREIGAALTSWAGKGVTDAVAAAGGLLQAAGATDAA